MSDEKPTFKLTGDRSAAVALDYYWVEDMTTCPRGPKLQLLGAGGVAVYGEYNGDPFWTAWAPCPKRRRHEESQYRVWPCGTVQDVSEGEPYHWMSDDYRIVWAVSEEAAEQMCQSPRGQP